MSNKTYPLQKTGSKVEELLNKIDVLSKSDIKLDQVDNTSDIDKPVSNLQRQALNEILEEAKKYTDNEIAEFDFIKIVSVLPGEGLSNRIYLVPKTKTEDQNLFDEYLWVNNSWEWIATKSIDVDLTNTYTKEEVDEKLLELEGLIAAASHNTFEYESFDEFQECNDIWGEQAKTGDIVLIDEDDFPYLFVTNSSLESNLGKDITKSYALDSLLSEGYFVSCGLRFEILSDKGLFSESISRKIVTDDELLATAPYFSAEATKEYVAEQLANFNGGSANLSDIKHISNEEIDNITQSGIYIVDTLFLPSYILFHTSHTVGITSETAISSQVKIHSNGSSESCPIFVRHFVFGMGMWSEWTNIATVVNTPNGGGGDVGSSLIEIIDNLTSSDTDKALSANQGRILNEKFIEKVDGHNILPPDYELGYYDIDTGLEKASSTHHRTPNAIPLKDGVNTLYVYENCGEPYGDNSYTNLIICYYDENDEYLGYSNGTIPFPNGNVWKASCKAGAKKFKVWIGIVTEDVNLAHVCISYTELDDFEPYISPIPKISETVNSLNSLFSDVGGHNILNPDLWEAGYFTGTAGNPLEYQTSSSFIRTIEPIEIKQGNQQLFIYENSGLSSGSDALMTYGAFLDSEGNFISGGSAYAPFPGGYGKLYIPINATHFEFYIRGYNKGYTFENICISYEMLDGFETYTDKVVKVLNSENLSDGIAPLAGKTIVNFGDSIFGNYLTPNDISTEISNQTGAKVYNCAFGGCRMGKHSEYYDNFSMYRLADAVASGDFTAQDNSISNVTIQHASTHLSALKSINFNEVDIVTIAYGTNDFTGGNVLDDEENKYNTDTFCGALRYSIETLLAAYPHLKIVVCSPTWRFWNDNGEYTYDSDTHIINDCLLTDFVKATNDVCVEYKIPFIDNYYSLGFNKFTRTAYFSATDGTHPQLPGRKLMGQRIARKLISESYDNTVPTDDIKMVLDELHNYAQALIGGENG